MCVCDAGMRAIVVIDAALYAFDALRHGARASPRALLDARVEGSCAVGLYGLSAERRLTSAHSRCTGFACLVGMACNVVAFPWVFSAWVALFCVFWLVAMHRGTAEAEVRRPDFMCSGPWGCS